MLLQQSQSLVLLIDIQQKLLPAIHNNQAVLQTAAWVLEVARELDVPVLITEQYPQGLGATAPVLAELIPADHVLQKMHFSALREPDIIAAVNRFQRKQLVVIGTETHVCVLQTVMDALVAGYQVFVVEDAVGSRTEQNKQLALSRMQQAGAWIISREMLAFEWLDKAGTDIFRRISKGWVR